MGITAEDVGDDLIEDVQHVEVVNDLEKQMVGRRDVELEENLRSAKSQKQVLKERRVKGGKSGKVARKVITPGGGNLEDLRKLYKRGRKGRESTSEEDDLEVDQNLNEKQGVKKRKGRKPVKEATPGSREVITCGGGKFEDLRKLNKRGGRKGGESIKLVRI